MFPIFGLLLGIFVGLALQNVIVVPIAFARYLSIATLAALDSAFGGLRATIEKQFDDTIFVIGLTSNTLMAAFITYMGDRLGVDLFLAAVVVFGVRLFNNLAAIRHHYFDRWRNNERI